MSLKTIVIGSEGNGKDGEKVINFLIKKLNPSLNIYWENSNKCTLIVKSHFLNDEKRWYPQYKKIRYLLWSGESYNPNIPKNAYKYLYISTTFINTPFICYTPFVLYSPYLYKPKLSIDISRPLLLAYCSSNKVPLREKLFNIFVEKAGIDQCHSLGQNFGSYPETQHKIEGIWKSTDLVKSYTKYKFVFAMENSDVPGYVTEKIMNAFHSGAIPIYWGNKYVKELFNEKAFIYVYDFPSLEACVDYVLSLTDEDREKMMNEPIYHPTNEIIHLMDEDFNAKNGNKILDNYLKKIKYILS